MDYPAGPLQKQQNNDTINSFSGEKNTTAYTATPIFTSQR